MSQKKRIWPSAISVPIIVGGLGLLMAAGLWADRLQTRPYLKIKETPDKGTYLVYAETAEGKWRLSRVRVDELGREPALIYVLDSTDRSFLVSRLNNRVLISREGNTELVGLDGEIMNGDGLYGSSGPGVPSPDGRRRAWFDLSSEEGLGSLLVIEQAGFSDIRIPIPSSVYGFELLIPLAWSADGTSLYAEAAYGPRAIRSGLWKINIDTKQIEEVPLVREAGLENIRAYPLLNLAVGEIAPASSIDEPPRGPSSLVALNLMTGAQTVLQKHNTDRLSLLAVSEDGSTVVFTNANDEKQTVWAAAFGEKTKAKALTHGTFAAMSSDGNFIAVTRNGSVVWVDREGNEHEYKGSLDVIGFFEVE